MTWEDATAVCDEITGLLISKHIQTFYLVTIECIDKVEDDWSVELSPNVGLSIGRHALNIMNQVNDEGKFFAHIETRLDKPVYVLI